MNSQSTLFLHLIVDNILIISAILFILVVYQLYFLDEFVSKNNNTSKSNKNHAFSRIVIAILAINWAIMALIMPFSSLANKEIITTITMLTRVIVLSIIAIYLFVKVRKEWNNEPKSIVCNKIICS